jgi:hypothetical protein
VRHYFDWRTWIQDMNSIGPLMNSKVTYIIHTT